MKRPRDFLFVSAGFLILVLTLTHTASGRAVAQEFLRIVGDVRITNNLDSPIPIPANDPIPVASSPDKPIVTTTTLAAINAFQKEVTIHDQPAGDGWFLSAGNGGIVAYVDPGSTVNVLFFRKSGSGTGTMTLTFTGHFIDQ